MLLFCFISVALGSLSRAQAPEPPVSINSNVADIVKARTFTEDYVVAAKKKFAADPKALAEAESKYRIARREYTGWTAYVASAITTGTIKDLAKDKRYTDQVKDAQTAGDSFSDYVDDPTKVKQTKAVIVVLLQLADFGIQLYNKVKTQVASQRKITATAFSDQVQWKEWSEIGKVVPNPAPGAAPTPPAH